MNHSVRHLLRVFVVSICVTSFVACGERQSDADSVVPNNPTVFLLSRTVEVDDAEITKLIRMLKRLYVTQDSDEFYASNIIIVDEVDRWAVSMHLPGNGDFRSRSVFGSDSSNWTVTDGRSVEYYSKQTLEILPKREGDLIYSPLETDLNLDENF